MAGKKFDNGKPDLSLIPLSALTEEAKGFMLGADKYGRYNYTEGLEASRLIAAALRHVHAWNQGEDLDPESGASHLGHARCCLAMILECSRVGTLKDDRYKDKEIEHVSEPIVTRMPDGTEVEWGPTHIGFLGNLGRGR